LLNATETGLSSSLMGRLGSCEDFNFFYEKLSSKWSNQLSKIIFTAGQFTQSWNFYEIAG